MKKKIKYISSILLMAFLLQVTPLLNNKIEASPGAAVSFQVFYDNLSSYGYWIDDPAYGYVWVPNVPPGFRPYYTSGYWVMTEYGNMWVSDYPWGWAPFHYGRWTYDSFYGWVWVPGYEWGPSWVCWRWGGGYYGWAPLRPGISLSMSFGNYYPPYDWWVFVPPAYIHSPHFYRYCRGPRYNAGLISNTTVIRNTYVNNNFTYVTGPRANEIQKVNNKTVPVYSVRNESKPGRVSVKKNTVNVYRPAITQSSTGGNRSAPTNFKKAVRPIEKPQMINSEEQKPEAMNKPENKKVENENIRSRVSKDQLQRSDKQERMSKHPEQKLLPPPKQPEQKNMEPNKPERLQPVPRTSPNKNIKPEMRKLPEQKPLREQQGHRQPPPPKR